MEKNIITFPTTTEAFIAFQEAGIHRELDGFERKLAAVVVEFANVSYQEGLNGEENTVTMDFVRAFYRERERRIDPFVHIWESICWWCDRAYMAGKETRRKTW